MKATELRIGNLVEIGINKNGSSILGEVEGYANYSILAKSNGNCIMIKIDCVKPIPLTEEWLLRFGFVKIENNWKCLDLIFATISWERSAGIALSFDKESIFLPNTKYVHQLQNLYFALTGEELTLKQ